MYWQAVVRDANGKIIKTYRREVGHSFLTQYYDFIQSQMARPVNVNATYTSLDITNTLRTMNATQAPVIATGAAAGDSTYGMTVGTGNTANAAATVALAAIINNGVGAGQLSYGSVGNTLPSGSAPRAFTLTRTFTNNSGGSIVITEAGIESAVNDTVALTRVFLLIRDVLGSAVTVINTASVTFTLTMSYTIS